MIDHVLCVWLFCLARVPACVNVGVRVFLSLFPFPDIETADIPHPRATHLVSFAGKLAPGKTCKGLRKACSLRQACNLTALVATIAPLLPMHVDEIDVARDTNEGDANEDVRHSV